MLVPVLCSFAVLATAQCQNASLVSGTYSGVATSATSSSSVAPGGVAPSATSMSPTATTNTTSFTTTLEISVDGNEERYGV